MGSDNQWAQQVTGQTIAHFVHDDQNLAVLEVSKLEQLQIIAPDRDLIIGDEGPRVADDKRNRGIIQ